MAGASGSDTIGGLGGGDTLSGGAGADTFHSFGGAGLDRVIDFMRAEGDRVLDLGSTFSTAQVGPDTVVTIGAGAQVVLAGVAMSSLTGDWIVVA